METLKIKCTPNFKKKLLNFVSSCDSNEIQIIADEEEIIVRDSEYWAYRKKLHDAVSDHEAGNCKTYSIEELDSYLDKIIAEYEN